MHGELHEDILEELNKVEACGIRELCLESRPHPDFCGDHWWSDVDFIMNEARRRGMRIWILDDDKFPTGHAIGAYETKHPDKAKLYLGERHMDIIGPCRNHAVFIAPFLPEDARLLGVVCIHKPDTRSLAVSPAEVMDFTNCIHNGFLYFNLPEGRYRLFILFTTRTGGGRPHYVNLIDLDSVRVLIDEVYEPHYARYKKDFGKTFAGFFSDEPELGNVPGYGFHEALGKPDVRLPWSDELEKRLKNRWENTFLPNLPALWYDYIPEGSKESLAGPLRYAYMEETTRLVEECFSVQIGHWCEKHGVEYIGHIIEDDNAHARLGCSVGHYFREQKGQHMAGIDVVHFQILPGFTEPIHQWIAGDKDGEFFHFGLAKLASSCSRIDPHKQGRALCEIFGNYGWAEGLGLMKWLCDHMLVRGINQFTPHAFSPRSPERDCPPHFYARGHNPQYRWFTVLMRYLNRVAHLLSGGSFFPEAAVLYHAESEWNDREIQLFQEPVRRLLERQMDCDVIPADAFTDNRIRFENRRMITALSVSRCMIVPDCTSIAPAAIEGIRHAADNDIPVLFVGRRPVRDTFGKPVPSGFDDIGEIISLAGLADRVRQLAPPDFTVQNNDPDLRVFPVYHDDGCILMLFNESTHRTIQTHVLLPKSRYHKATWYDAVNDCELAFRLRADKLPLRLMPGESVLYILEASNAPDLSPMLQVAAAVRVDSTWVVSLSPENEDIFKEAFIIHPGEPFANMNAPEQYPAFTGIFRYEGVFDVQTQTFERVTLLLPHIGDCADVQINGQYAGTVLGMNGRVNVTELLRVGSNSLRIEIANTLLWAIRDPASALMQSPPTGLLESPILEYWVCEGR